VIGIGIMAASIILAVNGMIWLSASINNPSDLGVE